MEQKKRLFDRMTNFINCDQVCFHKSKGKWTLRQSSGLCGRTPKAFGWHSVTYERAFRGLLNLMRFWSAKVAQW